jgi:hypothetical protein
MAAAMVGEMCQTTILTGGAGRGSTVLCLGVPEPVLQALAAITGDTGLVLLIGPDPPPGAPWRPVRCDPPAAIPIRSHVIDAAVVAATDRLPELSAELRRVLAPGGDVRVLTPASVADEVDAALRAADIRTLRRESILESGSVVMIARGP